MNDKQNRNESNIDKYWLKWHNRKKKFQRTQNFKNFMNK